MALAYPCPCCGYLTSSGPGSYDICLICFWEDDLSQLRFPKTGGANHVSLIEAQKNFAAFGACKERVRQYVRPVRESDTHDPLWRPIDPAHDNIERPTPGIDSGMTYPEDLTQLYYWWPNYWRRK